MKLRSFSSALLLVSAGALVVAACNDNTTQEPDETPGTAGAGGQTSTTLEGLGGGVFFGTTRSASSAPSTSGGDVDGVQYFGRWQFSDGVATASWGAVYLTTRFTGTSITLNMESGAVDYFYRIDGGELMPLSPKSNESSFLLAEGLSPGEHALELFRKSGGGFGVTKILGFSLDEGAELLPTERPTRKIEILGDSISVGYGNDGMGGTDRASENGYAAYGPKLARLFGASWSVVAHSGQGMVRNLGEEKAEIPRHRHMSDEFHLYQYPTSPYREGQSGMGGAPSFDGSYFDEGDYDFKDQPDALIIMLGTNDFSWPVWNIDPGPSYTLSEAEYVEPYVAFLEAVREQYPQTTIFAVGTLISNASNQFGDANAYICKAIETWGDANSRCVDPGFTGGDPYLTGASDYIGDWTHPTSASHTVIAERLAVEVEAALGWKIEK